MILEKVYDRLLLCQVGPYAKEAMALAKVIIEIQNNIPMTQERQEKIDNVILEFTKREETDE